MTKVTKKENSSGIERRRMRRRPILSTFSVFVVIPKRGIHKLEVRDLSESGMAFDVDVEGESFTEYSVAVGDDVDFRLYLNPSLFIPLSVRVVRVDQNPLKRGIGAEFQDFESESYKAFLSFLNLLDKIVEVAQIDPNAG